MTRDEFRAVVSAHGSLVEAAYQGESFPEDAPDRVQAAWSDLVQALGDCDRYVERWLYS